jgi:hypothetical protein
VWLLDQPQEKTLPLQAGNHFCSTAERVKDAHEAATHAAEFGFGEVGGYGPVVI